MNPTIIPCIISIVSSVLLSILITQYSLDKKFKKITIKFLSTVIWWQLSWLVLWSIEDKSLAIVISKIGYTGVIFLPSFCVEFILYSASEKKYKIISNLFYKITYIFVPFIWFSDLFVSGVYEYYFGFYPKCGIMHFIHVLSVCLVIIYVICKLLILYKLNKEKKVISSLISFLIFICAASDYLVNYGFEFYPLGGLIVFFSLSYTIFVSLFEQFSDVSVYNIELEKRLKVAIDQKHELSKIYYHDFKNYLLPCLTSIKRWKSDDFSEKIWKKLSMIKESIEKISRMSYNILNVYNPEKIRISHEAYKINDLINLIDQKWKQKLNDKGVLYKSIAHSNEIIKLANWNYMELVFDNLFANAYEHTHENGQVIFEIQKNQISLRNSGDLIRSDDIQSLFSNNQKLENRSAYSKGLGLPYCKMICEKMGGDIEYIAHDNGDGKNEVNEFRIIC